MKVTWEKVDAVLEQRDVSHRQVTSRRPPFALDNRAFKRAEVPLEHLTECFTFDRGQFVPDPLCFLLF